MDETNIGLMEPPEEEPRGEDASPIGRISWRKDESEEKEAAEAAADSIAEKLNKLKKIERIKMTSEEYTVTEEGDPFTYEDINALLYKLYPQYGTGKKQIKSSMEAIRRGDNALLFNRFTIDNLDFKRDFGGETHFTYSIKGNYNSAGIKQAIPRTELKKVTVLDRGEFLARFEDATVATDVDAVALAKQINEKYGFGDVLFDESKEKFVIDETVAYFDGKDWKVRWQDSYNGDVKEETVQVPSRNPAIPQGAELNQGFSSN